MRRINIALLKADHKQVKTWFEQFEKSRSDKVMQRLAKDICKALTIHTEIEEEEQPKGMFVESKRSNMDLKALGVRMFERK